MDREHGNYGRVMRIARRSGAPMNWSIKVGGTLFYREGEPFNFYWEDTAEMVWRRECHEGGHSEPVSLCYKGEPVRVYYPSG